MGAGTSRSSSSDSSTVSLLLYTCSTSFFFLPFFVFAGPAFELLDSLNPKSGSTVDFALSSFTTTASSAFTFRCFLLDRESVSFMAGEDVPGLENRDVALSGKKSSSSSIILLFLFLFPELEEVVVAPESFLS